MPFVSDEQRKAAFARMRGAAGTHSPGSSSRRPRTGVGGDPIMDAIGAWLTAPRYASRVGKGKGIPGRPGGPVTLTGGAIYQAAGSDWFIPVGEPEKPYFGQLPEQGVRFDTSFAPDGFQPAKTIWGSLFYISQGVDPSTGNTLPPQGTPGTLLDPISLVYAHERNDANPGPYNYAFQGGTGNLPSGYTGKARPLSFPALIQFIETHQDVPDFSIGGITFSFNPP